MKRQTRKQYRGWVLSALVALATLALIAVPTEGQPLAKWFALLFGSKALCFALFLLVCRLYNRWAVTGGFGRFFDRLLNTEED